MASFLENNQARFPILKEEQGGMAPTGKQLRVYYKSGKMYVACNEMFHDKVVTVYLDDPRS